MNNTDPTYTPAGADKAPNATQYNAVETPQAPTLPQLIVREGNVDTGVTHDGDMGRLGMYK